jgi:hypothetical protein
MPVIKEFIVLLDDQPSTLGKTCQALADREVNILASSILPDRREQRDSFHRRQSDDSQDGVGQ